MAVLALIAKFWNAKLGPMLPWLRGVRWVLWIVGTPLFLVGVVSLRFFWLVPNRYRFDRLLKWIVTCREMVEETVRSRITLGI